MVVRRRFGGWLVAGALVVQGCASIDPARVSPTATPTEHMLVAKCPAPSLTTDLASLAEPAAIERLNERATKVQAALPTNLRHDKVMKAVIDLLQQRRIMTLKTLALMASPSGTIGTEDRTAAIAKYDRAAAASRPARLSHADFEAFHHAILSPNGDLSGRVVAYESDYFNGKFFDRFGTGLTKPVLSTTVTDQQIAGFITALIEAVADELLFQETPVWVDGSGTVYYPGASSDMPSALAYAASPAPIRYMEKDDKGCGMTKLKARVLTWLSGQAATWAAGEAGIIMGAFGGVNAGPAIVLGKLSIGDNKLLLTIAQTVLSAAARRAVFETTWPLLLRIDQPGAEDSVESIVDRIDLR